MTEGHPDKICDQISDAILDAMLAQDPDSKVAVETLTTTGLVHVAGEVTTNGYVEIPEIVRKTILDIGYDGDKPVSVDTVVVSSQHAAEYELATLKADLHEEVVTPILERSGLDTSNTKIILNPSGPFIIGGPVGDAGLTGRKIIVDTYGGFARHGGGAFSGKDPSKVDRSAAYAMRWVAKNVVAAGLARRAEVQVAYAIGQARPVGLYVETFGTETVDPARIADALEEVFDLRPLGIIEDLDLKRPVYQRTAAHGHFGREEPGFTWEQTTRVDALRSYFNL